MSITHTTNINVSYFQKNKYAVKKKQWKAGVNYRVPTKMKDKNLGLSIVIFN